jgi:putative hemolysin
MDALLLIAVLLVLNGILAMAELAVMTSRTSRLQLAARAGSKGAAKALLLAREPTRFLSTVQVGITLIGIFAGAFGENSLAGRLEPHVARIPALEPHADLVALVTVVLGIAYLSLVFGELLPKRIALAHPEAIASLISRPLSALATVTALPVRILTWSTDGLLRLIRIGPPASEDVSEDDVRNLMARAAGTGIFTPQELQLFHRTMRAGDLVVRDLMVPRNSIVWIDANEPTDSVRVLVGTSPFSHFPVCDGDLDRIVGIVHVKDLISYGLIMGKEFPVTAVAQPPTFVPETMPALRLLDQFRASRNHLAFVVDEYGGTQGMLTLNDLTRAIIGDVGRTGEPAGPTMTRRDERSWLVDGRLPVHEFVVGLGLDPSVEAELPDASTVAGLFTEILGRIAREGERVDWRGFTIEVVDMDGLRVDKLIVARREVG